MEFDHQLGCKLELFQLLRCLASTQPLKHEQRVLDLRIGIGLAEHGDRVRRCEGELKTDSAGLFGEAADIVGGLLHDVDRAAALGVHLRDPERLELRLISLHAVAEIGGFVGSALRINKSGQITADADGIHVVEKERAMAAEQILDVVFRRRDQHVEAGFVHQPVE